MLLTSNPHIPWLPLWCLPPQALVLPHQFLLPSTSSLLAKAEAAKQEDSVGPQQSSPYSALTMSPLVCDR